MSESSSRERFEKLKMDRDPFLWRARRNAILSIPSIMPLEGDTNAHLYEPYQGLGAKGVVSMASRILMAFFPAGRLALRLSLPPEAKLESETGEIPIELQKPIKISEEMIQQEIEQHNWRDATFQSLQQLLVAGNVLEWLMPDNNIKVFRLDQYVVRRDFAGQPLEIIIKESMAKDALPPQLIGSVSKDLIERATSQEGGMATPSVDLFTHITWDSGAQEFNFRQEVENTVVSTGKFTKDNLPYFPLVWTFTPGEDYGRSKLEEVAGDLRSLETLEKAMLEGAAMAARNVIMLKPNASGGNLRRKLSKASNGDIVIGDFDSVKMLGFENFNGLQITASQVQNLRESLSQSFLLNQSVQRDAERVTAFEISKMIEELENSLGGVFSTLSASMMEPRINRLIVQMQSETKLPAWQKGDLVPKVITGLEALSRDRDIRDALEASQIIQQFGEEGRLASDVQPIVAKALIAKGFPEAVLTQEQRDKRRQQEQQQALMGQAAAGAIPKVAQEAAKGAVAENASK